MDHLGFGLLFGVFFFPISAVILRYKFLDILFIFIVFYSATEFYSCSA